MRVLARHAAEHNHEEPDDGEDHDQDNPRHPVEREGQDEQGERYARDADDLRQHQLQIAFHLSHAFNCLGGQRRRAFRVQSARLIHECLVQQLFAQLVRACAGVAAGEGLLRQPDPLPAQEEAEDEREEGVLRIGTGARPHFGERPGQGEREPGRASRLGKGESAERKERPAGAGQGQEPSFRFGHKRPSRVAGCFDYRRVRRN